MSAAGGKPASASSPEPAVTDLDIPTLTEPGLGQEVALDSENTGPSGPYADASGDSYGAFGRERGNPFAAASDDFFPSGQRKRLFDQLRHLSQWSRRALLVTGVAGSGKTMLYAHLARALKKDASAAALIGSQVSDRHNMFGQLTAQLGIDHADDASTELLNDLLRGYVLAQNDAERLCVILVDDAHELDAGAMEALLSLSADCRVRLIFFGEASLTKLVDKATVNLEIACHETPLLALSAADSRAYIEWRTKQLGYAQMPFNEEQLASLYSATDGVPGQIDLLASHMLQDMANSGPVHAPSAALLPVRQFPLQHLWLALALAAVLGTLYVLLDSPSEEAATEQLAEQGVTTAPESAAEAEAAAIEARLQQALAERQALEREAAEAAAAQAAANEAAAREAAAAEAAAAQQAAAEQAAAEQAAAEQSAAQRAAQRATQRAAEAEAAEIAAAEAAAAEAAAQEQAQQAAAPAGSDRALLDAVPGLKGSDWLLTRDGGHYTVQLVTLASLDGMVKYLRSQPQVERFATYTRQADGQTLYVATYGSFSTRAAADAAARSLPATVGNIQPWIRALKDVQQTIRTAN